MNQAANRRRVWLQTCMPVDDDTIHIRHRTCFYLPGLLGALFFWWVEKLLWLGSQRQLNRQDLGVIDEIDKAHHQSSLLQRSFTKRSVHGLPPVSLWLVIFDSIDRRQVSYGLYSYGLYSYGLYGYGLYL